MVTRRIAIGSGVVAALSACSQKVSYRSVPEIGSAPEKMWQIAFQGKLPTLELALSKPEAGGRLFWRAIEGTIELIGWSSLGLSMAGTDLFSGLTFERTDAREGEVAYPLAHGSVASAETRFVRHRFWFKRVDDLAVGLEVHAEPNGVAFRYLVPAAPGGVPTMLAEAENTAFAFPPQARIWAQPYMYPWKFGPSYEYYFANLRAGEIAERQVFPLLIERDGRFAFVTETGVDAGYAGSQLAPDPDGAKLICDFPLADEALGQGARNPTIRFPFASPWRTVAMGDLAAVESSTMVTDLAPPLDDRFGGAIPDWIKPGLLSWDWWHDRATGGPSEQRRYIDAIAEFGWTDVLVDAGWSEWEGDPYAALASLVEFGAAKGVGVHIWYNSGGANNETGGEPRDLVEDAEVRRKEFARISAIGVRGVKVDFWHSDKQMHIARYLDLLADAAENRLMVNFHGCTLPRGWDRQFPNLMTMEAVRGGETYAFPSWYKFILGDQGPSAKDHVRFALIRNHVGGMDYTPLMLAAAFKAHGLTYAHSLALQVVFHSALTHCADSIEAYRAHFQTFPWMREAIARVPLAWDETRLLSGHPDTHVLIARRSGADWHIAGITCETEGRAVSIDLAKLGIQGCACSLVYDGANGEQPKHEILNLADRLDVTMAPSGGFVAKLTPSAQPR